MQITYETQGEQTFLVYQLAVDEKLDRFSLGMIQNNKIHGLIPQKYSVANSEQYLKYTTSKLIPLKDFVSQVVTKQVFITILRSMTKTMKEIDAYLLLQEKVVFDRDTVFIHPESKEVAFVYLPISSEYNTSSQYRVFVRELIQEMQFDLQEELDYVAKLINFINGDKLFSLVDFDYFLQKLEAEPTVEVPKVAEEKPLLVKVETEEKPEVKRRKITAEEVFAIPLESEMKAEKINKASELFRNLFKKGVHSVMGKSVEAGEGLKINLPFTQNRKPFASSTIQIPTGNSLKGNSGVSMVAEESSSLATGHDHSLDQTTFLEPCHPVRFSAYLLRVKTGERIYLDKDLFRLGKDTQQVDFVIKGNPAISKCHVEIARKNLSYTVSDCQTTNGTFVNDMRLPSEKIHPLQHKDQLRLANEVFQMIVEK